MRLYHWKAMVAGKRFDLLAMGDTGDAAREALLSQTRHPSLSVAESAALMASVAGEPSFIASIGQSIVIVNRLEVHG